MTLPAARRHYRWNYVMWVTETAAWMVGTAFIDSTTVLPVLMLTLTDNPVLAGLTIALRYAGQGVPQLIAASVVSGRHTRKGYYIWFTLPGRLLLLWPMLLLLFGITQPRVVVPAIVLAYLAFWISEGLSIVPWVDMMGKTIPPLRRGRLFALMHVVGGLLGIGAGMVVRGVLGARAFPAGYGLLFAFALLGMLLSTISLSLLREPPGPPGQERYSTRALIADIPNLLRSMPQFRLLVLLQALFGFAVLPAPFYILYASEALRAVGTGALASLGVGVFLAIQTAGMILGNTVWGHLGDRYGNRLLLRVLAFTHTAAPLLAALAGWLAHGVPPLSVYLLFAPTFFLYGSLQGGTWMGITNFLLELAPEHDRPAYIAVMNALNLPAIILPLIGGALVRPFGYLPLFLLAAAALLYAALLTRRLTEPREMLTHHHRPPEVW
jgi:MFS family permease